VNYLKKFLAVKLVVTLALLTTACGGAKINGVYYDSYGLANEQSHRNTNVVYEISAGSVLWGIVLSETIIAPVYIIGWDLYKPVAQKAVPNTVVNQ
jgi:hypothetical protein